jgi:hypothetical protein
MKCGLHHAPLPQPFVTLGDDDAITIPLSEHLHRPAEPAKLFRFGYEHFSNGVGVKKDVSVIGTEAKMSHVAVAVVQLGVVAENVSLYLAHLRQPERPIARTRRKTGWHGSHLNTISIAIQAVSSGWQPNDATS